ncbi:hypothetical protein [Streptomyces sp. NPDC056669]|uniref:hypothetical protein n=1 Tax=Streptomyces sp. NPDC056669 TaxID=3345903 RepID=UPI0036A6A4D6
MKTIHDKAPNAKIVLMGYPRLLEDNGSCVLGMEDVEGKWLNSVADILADEMKGAVDDANSQYKAKAVFSDPRGVFTGKAICGDPESVHGIVISGQAQADNDLPEPSMQSFHPKPPQVPACMPTPLRRHSRTSNTSSCGNRGVLRTVRGTPRPLESVE